MAAELLLALAVAGTGVVFAYGGFSGWLAMQHFPAFYDVLGGEPNIGYGRLFRQGILGCAVTVAGLTYIGVALHLARRRRRGQLAEHPLSRPHIGRSLMTAIGWPNIR